MSLDRLTRSEWDGPRAWLGLALLILSAGSPPAWGDMQFSDYHYRMEIRFPGYSGAETLTNFPALILLGTNIPGFGYGQFESSIGGDLRFANSNETQALNFEIEKWVTNGLSPVWVQVPMLRGTDTLIYAYWGGDTNPPPCATNGATWSNGYAGVWHFSQNPTNVAPQMRDSTPYTNQGTCNGAMTTGDQVAGQMDGSLDFDGSDDYINAGNGASLSPTVVTFSAWLKITGSGSHSDGTWALTKGRTSGSPYMSYGLAYVADTDQIRFGLGLGGTLYDLYSTTLLVPGDPFVHVAGTYDKQVFRVYVNGRQEGFQNLTADINYSVGDNTLHVGHWGSGVYTRQFQGLIDEVLISSVTRSSNWIWATWFSQASNQFFTVYTNAGPTATTLTVRVQAPTDISLTSATAQGWIVHAGQAENPRVYLCWGPVDGGTNNGTSVWAYVDYLGTNWGRGQAFSTPLTGLISGSNYTYRGYVTNSTGAAWSDSAQHFTTIYLPSVTNSGATSIRAGTAVLQGEILDPGGSTPTVWLEYWEVGGATTSSISMGVQTGAFAVVVSDLEAGSSYQYRIGVSNLAGPVVSATRGFDTLAARYVALSGTGADGTTWATAYTNLETAVTAAGDGAVIYVKAGVFGLTNQIDLSGKPHLLIRGGYAGTTPEPGAVTSSPTVVSRNAAYNIRLFYGNASTVTWERITLQGGYLNAVGSDGGGFYFTGGSRLTLRNCVVASNQCYSLSVQEGGGLYLNGGVLTVENCTFVANALNKANWDTQSFGGAIWAADAAVVLSNTVFSGNSAWCRHYPCYGGAVYAVGGQLQVMGCLFTNNVAHGDIYDTADSAAVYGGALHLNGVAPFAIRDTKFFGNQCYGWSSIRRGDVLYIQGASAGFLKNCVVVQNGYPNSYGGVSQFYVAGGSLALTNVLAVKGRRGSAIRQVGGALQVVNCTLADNYEWGIYGSGGPTSRVQNCIVWSNGLGGVTGCPSVAYTFSQEIQAGVGNEVTNPLFVDTNYYHLASQAGYFTGGFFTGGVWVSGSQSSPAIDAGNPTDPFDNEPFPNGRLINLGAYGNTPVASKSWDRSGFVLRLF